MGFEYIDNAKDLLIRQNIPENLWPEDLKNTLNGSKAL